MLVSRKEAQVKCPRRARIKMRFCRTSIGGCVGARKGVHKRGYMERVFREQKVRCRAIERRNPLRVCEYDGRSGRKFAYRSTRLRRVLAELRARVSDHVANLLCSRTAWTSRISQIKNNLLSLARESTLQLKRANVKRTKIARLTK